MAENEEKKSVFPQIVVAVVVTLLVGGTSPWWWQELFHRDKSDRESVYRPNEPAQPSAEDRKKDNAANTSSQGGAAKPQVQGGKIQVRCAANPGSIAAGGQVEINVLALTEQDSPLSDASVRIESGGGWFSTSGTTAEVGQTGSNGRFTTRWKAPSPAAESYEIAAVVTKNGFTENRGRCRVSIQPANTSGRSETPKPQVQGGKIQVRCAANPGSIAAGGQVQINVLALTEQGSPLSGATVRIESGGGRFSTSGTTTEVGQTGANGTFATRWTSPNPAARGYGMGVTVAKSGFTEGKGEISVSIG